MHRPSEIRVSVNARLALAARVTCVSDPACDAIYPRELPAGVIADVFDQLVEMGDRLIVDSADFTDLLVGCRRLATLRRQSGVADLSWERLGWWQELTAQFFDAPRFRRYLPNLSRLQLRYAVQPPASNRHDEDMEVAPGTSAPMTQALLYAGWIATRLGWRRHRTLAPFEDGSFRLRLEGRHEMVDLSVAAVPTDEVRPGELSLTGTLTENAIRAACGIKFKPAMKAGKEVSQWVTLQYAFRLANSSIFGP